jgi:hypothetical protein
VGYRLSPASDCSARGVRDERAAATVLVDLVHSLDDMTTNLTGEIALLAQHSDLLPFPSHATFARLEADAEKIRRCAEDLLILEHWIDRVGFPLHKASS